MGVFSLLQQIYLHNKKEQQSAECIKGSLGVKGKLVPEVPENVDMIKYKLGGKKKNQQNYRMARKVSLLEKTEGKSRPNKRWKDFPALVNEIFGVFLE